MGSTSWRVATIVLLVSACESRNSPESAAVAEPVTSAKVTDLDGHPVDPLAPDGRVDVLVFVRTDLWLVYVDPDEDAARIRRHVADFSLPGTPIRDPRRSLVARAGVEGHAGGRRLRCRGDPTLPRPDRRHQRGLWQAARAGRASRADRRPDGRALGRAPGSDRGRRGRLPDPRAPTSAAAHDNLGNALRGAERPADAAVEFRAALALDPNFEMARNNLRAMGLPEHE